MVNPHDAPAVRAARRKERQAVSEAIHDSEMGILDAPSTPESVPPVAHIWKTVRSKLIEATKKHGETYDARHTQREFEIGDYVWVTSNIRQHSGLKAERPSWIGPYRIKDKRSPQVYQIRAAPDQASTLDGEWMNIDKLWPAHMTNEAVPETPMEEATSTELARPDFSSPLKRFEQLLKSGAD